MFAVLKQRVGQVLLPGDEFSFAAVEGDGSLSLTEVPKLDKVVCGPGLRRSAARLEVRKSGVLRFKEPHTFWIESHQRRYVPAKGETVIGIIASKAGDVFKVDYGGSEPASLSYLAFEGATKRNRPNVQVGDLVFAQFLVANQHMEPELVCVDGCGRANGMGVFGEGGLLGLCRRLLAPQSSLRAQIQQLFPSEVIVGLNGRVWVKASSPQQTLVISNLLQSAHTMTHTQRHTHFSRLANAH